MVNYVGITQKVIVSTIISLTKCLDLLNFIGVSFVILGHH